MLDGQPTGGDPVVEPLARDPALGALGDGEEAELVGGELVDDGLDGGGCTHGDPFDARVAWSRGKTWPSVTEGSDSFLGGLLRRGSDRGSRSNPLSSRAAESHRPWEPVECSELAAWEVAAWEPVECSELAAWEVAAWELAARELAAWEVAAWESAARERRRAYSLIITCLSSV